MSTSTPGPTQWTARTPWRTLQRLVASRRRRRVLALCAVAAAVAVTAVKVARQGGATIGPVDTAYVEQTLSLPGSPQQVLVDERGGRVFVASSGTAAPLPDWLLSMPLPPPMSPPCVPRIPRYLAPGSGTISVLDAVNGHLLRTIRTGTNPSVLGVDERAGRLLAGSAELFVPVDAPWHAALTQLRRWLPFLPSISDQGTTWHVPARLSVIDAAR